MFRIDDMQQQAVDLFSNMRYNALVRVLICLLTYDEQLSTNIVLLCQNIKVPSNTLLKFKKARAFVPANISEPNQRVLADLIKQMQSV